MPTTIDSPVIDYESDLEFVVELVKRAGELILEGSRKRSIGKGSKVDDKINRVDLVTETDKAVEKLIYESISKRFPNHRFIGEESFVAGDESSKLTDEPTWICDPIDGTTNFVHGFPHVCISIGFVIKKVPTIGVIYNPFLSQLYTAIRNRGSFLNQTTRLPLSYPDHLPLKTDLSDSLIAVEWGSNRSKDVMDKKLNSFKRLVGDPEQIGGAAMCHSLRSIGSAALNFAFVATGQLDIYWEIGCWAWDVCAGMVIAIESGAKCYGRGGKPINFEEGQDLMGHHFFVVRGISKDDNNKTDEKQDQVARLFFDRIVEEWDS
ncbi:hypothetical protein BY996DRAFT_4583321 [Phakopsora pachyrhizi]|nr:hypothetical protein BY996DRAFT_4592641 [Phakopsora pachyrhizi]KAI8453311.1 hypothetical protein BY996DRAFT_4583321 [Phakopsora pachyrhizi]